MKKIRNDINLLKTISIIAVVLYHMGFLKSGYLGVDIFLVINGYFIVKSLYKSFENGDFSYFKFILKRYLRLAPIAIIGVVVSLAVGFFAMLPDDYENLSQSSIASLFFSQNLLSMITTKNYWDVVNEYKPLMHFWYIGVLMEFYLLIPLIFMLLKRISNKMHCSFKKVLLIGLIVIIVPSFIINYLPYFSDGVKFYFVGFRLWEILLGGITFFISTSSIFIDKIAKYKILKKFALILIVFLLIIGVFNTNYSTLWEDHIVPIGSKETYNSNLIIGSRIATLLIVLSSLVYILFEDDVKAYSILVIGKMSYSIFVWHQIVLAFYRYMISYSISYKMGCIYILLVMAVSSFTYFIFEFKKKNSVYILCTINVLVLVFSIVIYYRSGVVRDVPELDIYKDKVEYKMHSKYCDRIYDYDKDFDDTGKLKILIIGNSFSRDFANILLESKLSDKIELSYIFKMDLENKRHIERIKGADYIFVYDYRSNIDGRFWGFIKDSGNVYGIGTKNFGECNGIIYSNRFKDNYLAQTINLNYKYKKLNEEFKNEWRDNYVDLIEVVEQDDMIKVFTDDNRFISQDCHHLTKAGAQYYASKLDFSFIK